MDLYAIRRREGWRSGEELRETGARSLRIGNEEMPEDVRWIRSYVVGEPDGTLGTVCIYEASSPEAIREHAARTGMPADDIYPVFDTVLIRADPGAQEAAA